MTVIYCPKDLNPCSCYCCRQGGCMFTAQGDPPLIKCPQCEELVDPRDFLTTKCRDCGFKDAAKEAGQ